MEKARALFRWNAIIVAVVTVSFLIKSPAVLGNESQPKKTPELRADIIHIDSMIVFGKLERPSVTFLHQKHTTALEKRGKDCSVCHLPAKDSTPDFEQISTLFMRLKNTSKQEVMDIYHDNCIACHKEVKADREPSGPLECGGCHRSQISVVSSRRPIGMDKSLHHRHSKAQDNKCEKCHHEYDENTKKLFYAKGKEGTCRYCHGEKKVDNRDSMRLASHISCVGCHRRTIAKNESAGPINCNGCHEPEEQKQIEIVKDVPRLKLDQPDYVFVKTAASKDKASNPLTRMNLVPFNHQAHEKYNDSCRVCHHAALDDCVQCHSLEGSKEGGHVTLQQAMHRLNVNQSCVGCHESKLNQKVCAGCHTSFEKKREQGLASCTNCHMVPASEITNQIQPAEKKMLATVTLETREAITLTYEDEDIPETVTIKALTDKYEPVKLPHRKIVKTLFNNIQNDRLANYFHHEQGTICQGCHHNSPAAKKPPNCASCHGRPFNEKDPFKPGLMAAYHRQCMECHRTMDIKKPVSTNCTACHAKKS
jgi:Class III cytochrome C family